MGKRCSIKLKSLTRLGEQPLLRNQNESSTNISLEMNVLPNSKSHREGKISKKLKVIDREIRLEMADAQLALLNGISNKNLRISGRFITNRKGKVNSHYNVFHQCIVSEPWRNRDEMKKRLAENQLTENDYFYIRLMICNSQ